MKENSLRHASNFKLSCNRRRSLEKTDVSASSGVEAKLPKLEIAKFDGRIQDWVRFWNQFRETIDKTNIAPVTKCTYLKNLLQPKVRVLIDGLPFTTEGYERAKNIPEGEYAKTSEIVNGHVQNIMDLPIINGAQLAKVHEFYKALRDGQRSVEEDGGVLLSSPIFRVYLIY